MNKISKLFNKNRISILIFPFASGSSVAQHSTAADLVCAEKFGILFILDFFFFALSLIYFFNIAWGYLS